MTGHFPFSLSSLTVVFLMTGWTTGIVLADKIVLEGDARLSGTVSSIAEGGIVELVTPLSPEPVLLRGESVSKVIFSEAETTEKIPGAQIELINGDVLPVAIEALDESQLIAISPVAGRLVIPRKSLKSLQLGMQSNRLIYSGPASAEGWLREGPNTESWEFEEESISLNGSGKISRKLETPERFVVKFTLSWGDHPDFQFSFADPLKPANEPTDRYFFQYSNAGLEIKREASTGKRFTTLMMLNRPTAQFPEDRMEVEIRVDRSKSMLYLFIDGEPEGRFFDPVSPVPNGGGISLINRSELDSSQAIEEIEISEWDRTGDRHRTDERGDVAAEVLIERRGDRYNGKLLTINSSENGPVFSFKSNFQEQPVELPESEISTIFFSEEPAVVKETGPNPFVLQLRGDGALRVSTCSFSGNRIEAVHPLLGPVSLTREGVLALERAELLPEEKP